MIQYCFDNNKNIYFQYIQLDLYLHSHFRKLFIYIPTYLFSFLYGEFEKNKGNKFDLYNENMHSLKQKIMLYFGIMDEKMNHFDKE